MGDNKRMKGQVTWNAETRSCFEISGPTAFWSSVNLSATM